MLMDYLPQIIKDTKEIESLMSAEEPDIERLWLDIEDTFKDQYFMEATQEGLRHYEKMLSIIPKLTDDIETRRLRLLARYNETLPYTQITVDNHIKTLCGDGNYSFKVVFYEYAAIVRIELVSKRMFNEVRDYLRRVLPANLLLDIDLIYNQHLTFEKITHREMNKYRHIDLREEVI